MRVLTLASVGSGTREYRLEYSHVPPRSAMRKFSRVHACGAFFVAPTYVCWEDLGGAQPS